VILIFCAFKRELTPLRTWLLSRSQPPAGPLANGLNGYSGQCGTRETVLITTGIGMRRARSSARRALDQFPAPEFILSTGVAGALDPGLAVGATVVADSVMTCHVETGLPEHILEVARVPRDAMKAALEHGQRSFATGAILSSKNPLVTVAAKNRAAELTGAVAVDMESAAIAYEAAVRGIPFVCLRTILDTAFEDVPGASLADENGRVRPFAAARAIVTNPAIIAGGIRLLRNLRVATNAMGEAVAAAIS